MVAKISREELKAKLDRREGVILVEALPEKYFRHSHLPGAINIPLEEIERALEAIPDKGAEIVVYCMDPPCEISEEAARELEAMGYANAREYVRGKQDWMEAGLPAKGCGAERKGS